MEGGEGGGMEDLDGGLVSCFKLFSVEYSLAALNFLKKTMCCYWWKPQ